MDTSPDKKVIFILGMHRSGTSALAGSLRKTGVYFGENEEMIPSEAGVNDKGFWEHKELVRINEQLLEEIGQRWFSPFAGRAFLEKQSSISRSIVEAAQDFVSQVPQNHHLFAIKDPRLCLTAEFWHQRFAEAGRKVQAIQLIRHPSEVSKSLKKRDNIYQAHGHALWIEHIALAERFCTKVPSTRIFFDHFVTDPEQTIATIAEALSLELNINSSELYSWIEPGLVHQRHSNHTTAPETPDFSSEEIYLELMKQGASMDSGKNLFYSWSENEVYLLNQLSDMFGDYNQQLIKFQEVYPDFLEAKNLLENHEKIFASQAIEMDAQADLIKKYKFQLNQAERYLGPIGRNRYRRKINQQ